MYLKFDENVDILVQIVNAKFENERGRTMGILGAKKFGNHLMDGVLSPVGYIGHASLIWRHAGFMQICT